MPDRTAANTATAHISEKEFQQTVIAAFTAACWHAYHNPDSRRSSAGWPDLQLLKPVSRAGPAQLVFAELKTAQGRTSVIQKAVHQALTDAGQEVYLWRPDDWPEIERIVNRRCPPRSAGV